MRVLLVLAMLAGLARADSGDRWNAATMGKQFVGGCAGAVTGAAAGALLGGIVGLVQQDGSDGDPLFAAGIGLAIGAVGGTVVGATYEGDQQRSTGKWWGAATGALGGTALFTGLVYLSVKTDLNVHPLLGSLVGAALIFGGTIAGYQLTADAHPAVTMRLAAVAF